LKDIFQVCDAHSFQLHIHAVGDKAVTDALDALEWTQGRWKFNLFPSICLIYLGQNGISENRHQIAHLQLIQPKDIPRFVLLMLFLFFY
jgi:predicted amidohydrolase YtcJ